LLFGFSALGIQFTFEVSKFSRAATDQELRWSYASAAAIRLLGIWSCVSDLAYPILHGWSGVSSLAVRGLTLDSHTGRACSWYRRRSG